jgi:chorismate--pyruvate lyase
MKNDLGKHALEPAWQSSLRLRRDALPKVWRSWLLDHTSLTRRLRQLCGEGFRVKLLSLRLERPMLSESRALGRPPQEIALVRQVHLRCGDTPWVFARTVIPLPSLKGGLRRLTQLGNHSLGAVLFADPHMQRSPMEVARIGPRQRLYRRSRGMELPDGNPVWGRRSVFNLRGNALLVSEFFLPELLQYEKDGDADVR